jgi:site-specific DNA-methyltransferase (adenine-specific)
MIGGLLNALGLTVNLLLGDCRKVLPTLPAGSVHCCVTSPPYFGLRDYGHENQIGLEQTPDAFAQELVGVFREVRRVLRDDGTLWLNLGDSYNAYNANRGASTSISDGTAGRGHPTHRRGLTTPTLKNKDLIGIPWRVAFALQADGWYLRQDIIWHKPNPMPESVRDRCTKAHEYIFLLSKSPRYYFDSEAIKELADPKNHRQSAGIRRTAPGSTAHGGPASGSRCYTTKNKRSVWSVTVKPFKGAHFATFPPDLIEPCVLAGCPIGGTVLDPFMGSGTTAAVALQHGRQFVGVELNPEYLELARRRTGDHQTRNLESPTA